MGRPRTSPEAELRGMQAFRAHIAYQKTATSTPAGKKADELRERAHRIVRDGDQLTAHGLYREALGLFGPDDDGPGAAAAAYDLAESYATAEFGVHRDNLHEAERLFRKSLASPARQKDPTRLALTWDGLARCLRHLAHEPQEARETEALLDEAERCFRNALKVLAPLGRYGWMHSSDYSMNLGNLYSQRGRLNEAIARYEETQALAEAVEADPNLREQRAVFHDEPTLPRLNTNFASVLLRRNKAGDLERALRCAAAGAESPLAELRSTCRLLRARILLKMGKKRRAEALSALHAIQARELDPEQAVLLVELLGRYGTPDAAALTATEAVQARLQERRLAIADHVADHHAVLAQRTAWTAARVLVDRGEAAALDAFLLLESVSGLRTLDAVGVHHYRPSDGVAIALNEQRSQSSYRATHLDDLAGRLSLASVDQQRQILRTFLQDMSRPLVEALDGQTLAQATAEDLADARAGLAWHRDALEEALLHASPMAHLQELARQTLAETARITTVLDARDPRGTRQGLFWNGTLDRRALRLILDEHPELALLRLHALGDELVMVGVWLKAGHLIARGHRIEGAWLRRHLAALLLEHTPATSDLDALIQRIDLSPALPPEPREHLVVLPNLFSSRLPVCALGPCGRTPLDRFQAISVLPNLTPLAMRQGAQRPREGLLVVAPGRAGERPTALHDEALGAPLEGEQRLAGAEATVESVHVAAQQADVIRFYAHGGHFEEMTPHVHLADGPLEVDHWRHTWIGAERVELWACATGVDLPRDPLSPLVVDEGFGLDVQIVHAGARSALGTLWEVPEGAVAGLLRHYRAALARGRPAPHALADAQRAWRDGGRDELQAQMDLPPSLVQTLIHPAAWAGYRFLGVAERRPLEPWTSQHGRLPTAEERAEADGLLSAPASKGEGRDLDEMQAERIDRACDLEPGGMPTGAQAAEAGRAWMRRLASSGPHSVAVGLAWLHEALADPMLPEEEAEAVRLDAAWAWFELARDEVVTERMMGLHAADPVLVTRGSRLLKGTSGPMAELLRGWGDCLVAAGRGFEALEEAARAGLGGLGSVLERLGTPERLRGLTVAAQILLCLREPPAPLTRRVLALANEALGDRIEADDVPDAGDLAAAVEALAAALALTESSLTLHPGLYPHRSLARHLQLGGRSETTRSATDGIAALAQMGTLNETLGTLEGRLWGYPSDDRLPFWSSTGTPGRAWSAAMGALLHGMAVGPGARQKTAHIIANLQNGCDLRLGALNALARMWGRALPEEKQGILREFHRLVWTREQLLLRLMGCAAVPEMPGDGRTPHRLNPFSSPVADLLRCESPMDLAAWCLHDALEEWWDVHPVARTAAGKAARQLAWMDKAIRARWAVLAEGFARMPETGAADLRRWLDPKIALAETEKVLQDVPEGEVVVGVSSTPDERLMLFSLWRRLDGTQGEVAVSEPGVAMMVRHALALLGVPEEASRAAGMEGASHEALWSRIDAALSPLLDRALGPALTHAELLSILAPGPLRLLPWLGLRVRGRPLYTQVVVRLQPDLGWGRVPPSGSPGPGIRTACVLPPDEPETAFGLAAISSLRARFPAVLPLEAPEPCENEISEIDRLEPYASRAELVRLYGDAAPGVTTSAAGLALRWRRTFGGQILRNLWLPEAEVVELWSAAGGAGAAQHLRSGSGDVFPGLVWPLLATGAGGMVDMAWDVPDLVRALVAERFGVLLRSGARGGAAALREAVAWTSEVLAAWRKAGPFAEARVALRWLDGLRLHVARKEGYEGPLMAFAKVRADALPEIPVAAWLVELTRPWHLASFRWWGL